MHIETIIIMHYQHYVYAIDAHTSHNNMQFMMTTFER